MKYHFDFDVAWDSFENEHGYPLPGESEIRIIGKAHGVVIDRIIYEGPGGGNPNIFATAPSREVARKFLAEIYECKTEEDIKSFCDPALPPEE